MIYQNTGPSGGKVAYLLNTSVRMPYGNSDNSNWNREFNRENKIPPVNFGCARKYIPLDSINYNSEDVQDKLFCFSVFEAAGINYPKLINPENYKDKPFLGRKNKSSKGKGIIKYKSNSETWKIHNNDFYVEFLNITHEFRVHVWGEHILIELNKDFSNNNGFIHNFDNGSKLVPGYLKHNRRDELLKMSIDAIKYCGLDFGAVDLAATEDGNIYCLEVNSSPSLAHTFGYIYALHMRRIFNLNIEFDWYIDRDFKIKKTPKSYYFGNNI